MKTSDKLKAPSIISTVGIMMAITLTGKVMGILRERMLVVNFGTYTAESIAFTQASLLPRVFLDIMFASVFSASFIPVFNRYLETKGKQAAFDLAARFIKLLLLITIALTALFIFFATPIYTFVWGGEALPLETRLLGISLLRIMFPIMVISSLAFSLTGILQSLGQFNIPAAMSVASNGIILLYYFFFIDYFGIYGLAAVFLLGWSAQVLIQIPFLVKHQFFKARPKQARDTEALREIGQLTLPVMVASWLGPVNFFINTRASVNLEHGIVAMNTAHTLFIVITGFFVLSLTNVLFPTLSKLAAHKDWKAYAAFLRSNLRGLMFLLLPMTFGLMAVAEPLIRLFFQGGLFQEVSVGITATALFYFSLGIVGFGMQNVLSRACFALQDGRGPLIIAVLAMTINFVLSFTLAPIMGIGGPALASAIAISIAGMGFFVRMWQKLPESLWTWAMTVDTAKMLILSVAMFLAVRYGLDLISGWFAANTLLSRVLMVGIPAGLGVVIYMIGAFILKVPEAKFMVKLILNKLDKIK